MTTVAVEIIMFTYWKQQSMLEKELKVKCLSLLEVAVS